jgi:hypothetical protein
MTGGPAGGPFGAAAGGLAPGGPDGALVVGGTFWGPKSGSAGGGPTSGSVGGGPTEPGGAAAARAGRSVIAPQTMTSAAVRRTITDLFTMRDGSGEDKPRRRARGRAALTSAR